MPATKTRTSSMIVKRPQRPVQRNGSAIVLCFLAIAVISMASISIVRGHRRANVRSSARHDQAEGRAIAEGLLHRHVALVRANGGTPAVSMDPELATSRFPNAWMPMPVTDTVNETVSVQVYLYQSATQPAASITSSYRP